MFIYNYHVVLCDVCHTHIHIRVIFANLTEKEVFKTVLQ